MHGTQRSDKIVAIAVATLLAAGCIEELAVLVLTVYLILAIVFCFAPGRAPQ